MSVQRFTLYTRSTHERGGEEISNGKRATAVGVEILSPDPKLSGVALDSRYTRIDDAIELVTQ